MVQHSPKMVPGEASLRPDYVTLHHWPLTQDDARTFQFDMTFETAQLSPDGGSFCFIQKQDTRRLYIARASDGEIIASGPPYPVSGTGSELAWSNDGRHLAVVSEGKVIFYRTDNLTIVGVKLLSYPSSAAFTTNGKEVVFGSWKTSMLAECEELLGA